MAVSESAANAQRLAGKVALVVGGGQLAGADTGNGRATAQLFAEHGAGVAVVDRNLDSAQETVDLILGAGGEAFAVRADVASEAEIVASISACQRRYGRIDILHYNVGVGVAAGDAPIADLTADAFDRIMSINLRGMVLACRHTLPIMREQGSGVVITISSNAALTNYPYASYKISKAAVITTTQHVAVTEAGHGIRANTILPGLMSTPMAIEYRIKDGLSRDDVIADRQSRVPLRGRAGSAWDVANAALFLASEEASFITGAQLVVDGGQSLLTG